MLKKIGFAFLFAVSILSPTAYSVTTHVLQTGYNVDFDFPPNEPQELVNYMFWTINAVCYMGTTDSSDDMYAEVLAKSGRINSVSLTQGQSISLTIQNNDIVRLSAASGAKVRIENRGLHTIKAKCMA